MRLPITPGLLNKEDMLKTFRKLPCTNIKNKLFLNNRHSMESDRFQILFDNMIGNIFLFYRTELGLSWSLKVGDIYEKF